MALVRYLREHCEWDARQTPASLVPYLLEEAHEVADAVRHGDDDALSGELGDLLLNVAFQVVLAEERGSFCGPEVVDELEQKMEARHPHVYGDADEPPDWERLKADERAERDAGQGRDAELLEGVPAHLEPLSRAFRVQERAAAVGFDWPDPSGALDKLREETAELESLLDGPEHPPSDAAVEDEAGDVLFAAVNVLRLAGVHPLTALERATDKFARRFRRVAERALREGLEMRTAGLASLDRIWDAVKEDEDQVES